VTRTIAEGLYKEEVTTARGKGLLVVHVGVAFRPGHPEIGPGAPLFQGIKQANALLESSWGADFHPGVKPAQGEIVVIKRGVSALAGTDLNARLHSKGINTLVLTGIATNFVIEGTARHAVDEGYQVVVLTDCCASFNEQMHTCSLQILSQPRSCASTRVSSSGESKHSDKMIPTPQSLFPVMVL